MRRLLGLTTIAVLVVGGAVGCSSDDKDDEKGSDTTAKESDGSDSSGNSEVDEYCKAVDDLIEEYKKVMEDPTSGNAAELTTKATELSQQASDLTAELVAEPELAKEVTDCTEKLSTEMAGG